MPVTFPYNLDSNNLAVMYTSLSGVLFYEIRIIQSREKHIIANCFGRNANLVAQEGNTVLNNQLVKIDSGCRWMTNVLTGIGRELADQVERKRGQKL